MNARIFPIVINSLILHIGEAFFVPLVIHAEFSRVLSLIFLKSCTSNLISWCHTLSKVTSHQPRIVYFVQEAELEVGIIQFSGEKIAKN